MSRTNKVLHLRLVPRPADDMPDTREIQVARFEVSRACPWWVGKCPLVHNAIDWVTGADAAAIYLVRGHLAAVVGRRAGRRVVWATADLGDIEQRLAG